MFRHLTSSWYLQVFQAVSSRNRSLISLAVHLVSECSYFIPFHCRIKWTHRFFCRTTQYVQVCYLHGNFPITNYVSLYVCMSRCHSAKFSDPISQLNTWNMHPVTFKNCGYCFQQNTQLRKRVYEIKCNFGISDATVNTPSATQYFQTVQQTVDT